jgi:hypothetical protein
MAHGKHVEMRVVLRVNGRVGLVEEGSTFFKPATLMMSGAWPPPAGLSRTF